MLSNKLLAAMGGSTPSDPNFANTVLLLHGNGTNGAQNNTFVDSSTNNFTVTRAGNVTQGAFSPFGAEWSAYFDGSGDYIAAPSSAAFNFGTGDFTVEAWVFRNTSTTGYETILGFDVSGGLLFQIYQNQLDFALRATASNMSGVTVPSNVWVHLAISRQSGVVRYFQNGTLIYTYTGTYATHNFSNSAQAIVSGYSTTAGQLNGYISNLRVVKGAALYTSAFTPSTTPLTAVSGASLLACQSNRFIDVSSNNFTLTPYGNVSIQRFSPFAPSAEYSTSVNGGSGYFDGNTSYLTAGVASDWTFLHNGQNNYTIEFFLLNNTTSRNEIVSTNTYAISDSRAQGITLYSQSNALTLQITRGVDGSYIQFVSNAVLSINQWNHCAITFNSSTKTVTFYINGVSQGSSSNTGFAYTTAASGQALSVGRYEGYGGMSSGGYLNGYLASLRMVKSIVYSSAFTPTTTPLTAITNTSLLLNFTNAGIIDHTAKNVLETVGNAQVSTTQKKYGTGAMYFDGTGDYLTAPSSADFNFGAGNFTIEGWLNLSDTSSSYKCILSIGIPVQVYARNGNVECYLSNTSNASSGYFVSALLGPSSSISANTWAHFALVRNGNTFTAYVNGVGGTSITTSAESVFFSGSPVSVGLYVPSMGYALSGYIDDLRITKGVARYTANFTPPALEFPNK